SLAVSSVRRTTSTSCSPFATCVAGRAGLIAVTFSVVRTCPVGWKSIGRMSLLHKEYATEDGGISKRLRAPARFCRWLLHFDGNAAGLQDAGAHFTGLVHADADP